MSPLQLDPARHQWQPQPEVAERIDNLMQLALDASPWLRAFRQRLLAETGTRLLDWLDHIAVADTGELTDLGFHLDSDGIGMIHPGGLFPTVLEVGDSPVPILAVKVEDVDAFLSANDLTSRVEIFGAPKSRIRLATVDLGEGGNFRVVERHGYRGFSPGETSPQRKRAIARSLDSFRERPRSYADPQTGFDQALRRLDQAKRELGLAPACDLFFRAEREYWQARNQAARIQLERQNQLGLGWANHDHHTYRCSREWFASLVHFLEQAGFRCRERFYAGSDAGWGAQVLEHHDCGLVVFADVDMTEQEVTGDFAHEGLPAKSELGTVGLWCKLHGDSFLAAGMHHLECQFDFDAARHQLAEQGIESMAPFTDFPYLRQAFTKGELWKIDVDRLDKLVMAGAISTQDAQRFATSGALGSHLEILERNDGYKGFNQTGISKIILETNPKTSM